MRFIETLLVLLLSASALVLGSVRGGRLTAVAGVLCGCAALAQLSLEGFRLQALPLYAAAILIFLCTWQAPASLLLHLTLAATALILCITGALACYRYPVIQFPSPPGPHAIGTQTFYLQDSSRKEKYGSTPDGRRRFAVQVWYPASPCTGPNAPYRDPGTLIWKSAHLQRVKTHACLNAPIASSTRPWPVVFFSPSSGGYRSQNTFLAEWLVSQGYVFVAFDHPDTSSRILFPDGSLMHSLPDTWLNLQSRVALARSMVKTEELLQTNVADLRSFLDRLVASQPADPWYSLARHLDFSRVAAVGHSFGGAAAAEACRVDRRFRTGVNMDGWMFGEVNRTGVGKPFLFLIEGSPLARPDQGPFPDDEAGLGREGDLQFVLAAEKSVDRWGGAVIRLLGADHGSFADMALMVRPYLGQSAQALAPATGHRIINNLIQAFLDDHLSGTGKRFEIAVQGNNHHLEVFNPAVSVQTE